MKDKTAEVKFSELMHSFCYPGSQGSILFFLVQEQTSFLRKRVKREILIFIYRYKGILEIEETCSIIWKFIISHLLAISISILRKFDSEMGTFCNL